MVKPTVINALVMLGHAVGIPLPFLARLYGVRAAEAGRAAEAEEIHRSNAGIPARASETDSGRNA